jgi:lysozyme family protein
MLDYAALYTQIIVDTTSADAVAQYIINEPRYAHVAKLTGVDPDLIGALHFMESSSNFNTHLHNGDSLKKRTINVPKGRPSAGKPPFKWVDSAVDALTYDNVTTSKDRGKQCEAAVKYNGLGYERYGIVSPYGFSQTSFYSRGLFVSDGKFSPETISKRPGVCLILKRIDEIRANLPLVKASTNGREAGGNQSMTVGTDVEVVKSSNSESVPNTTPTIPPTLDIFKHPAPNVSLSTYFKVGEFTRSNTRPFENQAHLDSCKELAGRLDAVRDFYNRPIKITSGVRDKATNRRVGGAAQSAHVFQFNGTCAADFIVKGVSSHQVYADFDDTYEGGLGKYNNGTTHMDNRKTGKARWFHR